VPIIEAQACGVPAIVTDFSAMKEVCGAGWKVPARPQWTGQNSWQASPDVGEMLNALEKCYRLTAVERESLAKKARRHAMGYAVPKVIEEHLLPALAEVRERVGEPVAA
jgi:glycosyltransferase involved in cell wall biosynthesis